jgi:hypothetical protein
MNLGGLAGITSLAKSGETEPPEEPPAPKSSGS